MSHFTVLVVGDVESQLAPYDEQIEIEKYQVELVSEEDKQKFLDLYQTPSTDRDYAPITEEQAEENKKLSFDELYDKYGEDWNGGMWEKNEDDELAEFSTYNPKSKWDWYTIGGRWSGTFFILKPESEGGVVGSPGSFGNETGIDGALFGDIDWAAMRKRGEDEAKERWEKVEEALGGVIPQPDISWAEIADDDGKYKDMDWKARRELYHSQPVMKLIEEANEKEDSREIFGFFFSIEDFACGKEEYIRRGGINGITPYALVVNGEWHEKGQMGWWGMSSGDKEPEDWGSEVEKLLKDVDEEEEVYLVDCHI